MKYEYDAAGRLVKEGDKVYSYIGLDKIESVTEGGRKLSSFTYHIDGQLAARVSIESSETFHWDGLALIQRNSTSYVNEPAVTGGNPILADDKILFNDMLGTTLGVKDGDKVTQNNLTAFGESLSASPMQDSFFTGKPHVGELGYAFLFQFGRQLVVGVAVKYGVFPVVGIAEQHIQNALHRPVQGHGVAVAPGQLLSL